MNILCFSINPIFPDFVSGGASKHLMNLTRYLSADGHRVRVLCPSLPNQDIPFSLSHNLEVWPVLPFHQPFPAPYAVTPSELALIVEEMNRQIDWAERFYVHDGELLLPQLHIKIPTILSFRDNYYPESILGSFINQADEIICVSPYSASVIQASAGRVVDGLNERIHVVLNGIDPKTFKPIPLEENLLLNRLPFDPTDYRILLHPHRPDPNKGLAEALELLNYLVNELGKHEIILLTPRWHAAMNGSDEETFFHKMQILIEENNLKNHIHFLDWLSQIEMPSFYSLGHLNLCLGRLPEAFGNVAYESLACGTPSLVCRVGVHRSLLPDSLIHKVDYWDSKAAGNLSLQVLENGQKYSEPDRLSILKKFDLETQLSTYKQIILNAHKRTLMKPIYSPVTTKAYFRLAPWCFLSSTGIYHDHLGKVVTDQNFSGVQIIAKFLSNNEQLLGSDFPRELIDRLYRAGVLVPIQTD